MQMWQGDHKGRPYYILPLPQMATIALLLPHDVFVHVCAVARWSIVS